MGKSENIFITVGVSVAVLLLIGLLIFVPMYGGNLESPSSTISYEKYFNPNEISRLDITIDEDVFNRMLNQSPDRYVPCTITLNGDTYTNIGIKTKGDATLELVKNSKTSNRYGFKLKADAFTKQSISGLDILCLNSDLIDATMLREYLCYDLLKEIGVKTPLYSYVAITINGKYWGLYLMVEGINNSFLQRNYGEINGSLYRPEGLVGTMVNGSYGPDLSKPHYGGHLEYVGEHYMDYDELFPHQVTGIRDDLSIHSMMNIIKHLNSDENVDSYVNMDEVIPYLAMNVATSNTDSYLNQGYTHNFYLYESEGKVTIFPWDFDVGIGPFFMPPSEVVNLPIDMPVQTIFGVETFDRLPLMEIVIKNPEYREKYHNELRNIAENYLGDTMIKKIDALVPLIRPYMETDPNISFPYDIYFDKAVENLKKFVTLRTKSLLGQLDGTIPTTYEEQRKHPELIVDPGDLDLVSIGSSNVWKEIWK